MTDTEIALLQAIRVEVAALRATVERGDHSINLLIEQVRVLYEDVTNLHDRMARIEERLRVPAPSLGRGYAGGKAPPAECKVEGCDARAVSKGLCARHYMRMRADERRGKMEEPPPP